MVNEIQYKKLIRASRNYNASGAIRIIFDIFKDVTGQTQDSKCPGCQTIVKRWVKSQIDEYERFTRVR